MGQIPAIKRRRRSEAAGNGGFEDDELTCIKEQMAALCSQEVLAGNIPPRSPTAARRF